MIPDRPRAPTAYLSNDTIAAPTTAAGGAVAIVRVSGPAAGAGLAAVCRRSDPPPPRRLERRDLFADEHGPAIDSALVAWFPGPGSFTGEDVAEFQVHGSPAIVSAILDHLRAAGARLALPGEFSFRAVRNGKLAWDAARALPDLIQAQDLRAAGMAFDRVHGTGGSPVAELARDLENLLALAEAGLDFADQDLDEVSLPRLRGRAAELAARVHAWIATAPRGRRIREGMTLALIGPPNSGKSTLFNAWLGSERAIVSEIPGTTRDLIEDQLVLRAPGGAIPLRLMDTAGLRASGDALERAGMERTRGQRDLADCVLWVLDLASEPAGGATSGDALVATLDELRRDRSDAREDRVERVILTKADLVAPAAARQALERVRAATGLGASALSVKEGFGVDDALVELIPFLEARVTRRPGEFLVAREDELLILKEAVRHLERAERAPLPELLAADLRQALASLEPCVGHAPTEAILDRVFSQFCIGK